jgi:hypothetical protein
VYDLTARSDEIALEWSSRTCPGTRIAVVGAGRSSKAKAAYFNVVIGGVDFQALSAATPPMGPGGAVCLPPVCVQPAPVAAPTAAGAIEVEGLSDDMSNLVVSSLSPERRHTPLHTPVEPYVSREGAPGAGQHKTAENVETVLQHKVADVQGFSAAGNMFVVRNFVLLILIGDVSVLWMCRRQLGAAEAGGAVRERDDDSCEVDHVAKAEVPAHPTHICAPNDAKDISNPYLQNVAPGTARKGMDAPGGVDGVDNRLVREAAVLQLFV